MIAIVACYIFWWTSAGLRGRLTARYDVAHGRYRILTYGLPFGGFPEYQRLLRDRYGIEVRPVAGCVVSFSLRAYADAYDNVSVPAANRKVGHDVFKEAEDEANKLWQDRTKKAESVRPQQSE